MSNSKDSHIRKIRKLEAEAIQLDPSSQTRTELQKDVLRYSNDFLDNLSNLPTYNQDGYDLDSFAPDEFIDEPTSADKLLKYVEDHVHQPGINAASGGHMGFIPGGGVYTAALGDYLAAVFNRYAGVYFAAPGAIKMENALIRWTGKLLGYAGDFAGNIASGGSIANLIAITTARNAHGIRGKDYEKTVIYYSEQVHHCVLKDLRVAGLDECVLRQIPLNRSYQMDAGILEKQILEDRASGLSPFLLIASAGTTDSGAIDPLDRLGDISREQNLWFHVDAAYGGYFMLTEEGSKKLNGIAKSDSVVVDPHKGLFLPFGTGIVIVKKASHLRHAHDFKANYMQDTDSFDQELSPADASPELTKHFRGMRMWLPLRLHGIAPFRACLDEKLELARYFYREINLLGFETGPSPELTVVLFRKTDERRNENEINQRIARRILEDGTVFLSTTTINGVFWLRVAILSFRTHLREVDLMLDRLREFSQAN
ncbi:pyridoxal phosphate-dependent decarboxylase family protein [Fulvivirga sedimenti]|uniref:Amino acid decarboxylase n=1 Tax=Fulvivirga sedimenti TaxID=2879465 RepID=A0A9X1HNU7_9BACT|nr:pyridoxal-dependent decarboxylase [Fulvivirga sedimenti]MCA6074440.1 amino acid decarboxylase [Fulvivirga sedimenti]